MNKLTKNIMAILLVSFSLNAFAGSELAGSVSLKKNTGGYKLKFINNLSELIFT